MRAPWVTLLGCLALVACGSEDGADQGGGGSAGVPSSGASLSVTVQRQGPDGPTERRRIECRQLGAGSELCVRLARLRPRQLAPVPPTTACAELYGGPARARVRGELRGKTIDASFNRVNGCEIERWDDNRVLLGPPGHLGP